MGTVARIWHSRFSRRSPPGNLIKRHALAPIVGACEVMASENSQLPGWLGRLLCLLGFHEFQIVESVFGFGLTGQVDKVECRRCGHVTTRRRQIGG